jgi:hypothetical protein
MWCKDWLCLEWGSRVCVLCASSSETSRLLYPSSGHQHQRNWYSFFAAANISSNFHFLESGPWTEKKLRYPTMRYITRPISIASIGATGSPQSLSVALHGSSCSSISCSESIDLWHMEHVAMHASQRSKAHEQIVYTRASLDACTWEL